MEPVLELFHNQRSTMISASYRPHAEYSWLIHILILMTCSHIRYRFAGSSQMQDLMTSLHIRHELCSISTDRIARSHEAPTRCHNARATDCELGAVVDVLPKLELPGSMFKSTDGNARAGQSEISVQWQWIFLHNGPVFSVRLGIKPWQQYRSHRWNFCMYIQIRSEI